MVRYHLHILGRGQYAVFAAICIHSLINRGKVQPEQIQLTTTKYLVGHETVRWAGARGVAINVNNPEERAHGKFTWCQDMMLKDHRIDKIVQIDSDMCLTEECYLDGIINKIPDEIDILTGACNYTGNDSAIRFWERGELWCPSMQFNKGGLDFGRANALIWHMMGFRLVDIRDWLKERKIPWTNGGIYVINRRLRRDPAWGWFDLLSHFTYCDESIYQLANYATYRRASNFQGCIIGNEIGFRMNPEKFSLDLDSGPGFIHYAGDWYRNKPEHRAIIDAEFLRITSR